MIAYWCDGDSFQPPGVVVDSFTRASEVMKELKADGATHVVLAPDPMIQVGADDAGGIASDGKLPAGLDYTLKKRRP